MRAKVENNLAPKCGTIIKFILISPELIMSHIIWRIGSQGCIAKYIIRNGLKATKAN